MQFVEELTLALIAGVVYAVSAVAMMWMLCRIAETFERQSSSRAGRGRRGFDAHPRVSRFEVEEDDGWISRN